MAKSWAAKLNGVLLAGGNLVPSGTVLSDVQGWLSDAPDGLGVPDLRVEDQTLPQRDGDVHYSDWYSPRIITLADVSINVLNCSDTTARQRASNIMAAWARQQSDIELVLWTDMDVGAAQTDRAITGPFGVKGRPRAATMKWNAQGSKTGSATLRFDSVDHRLYILDSAGTPGSGTACQYLTRNSSSPIGSSYAVEYTMNEAAATTGPTLVTGSAPNTAANMTFQGSGVMTRGLPALALLLKTSTLFTGYTSAMSGQPFAGYTFGTAGLVSVWWKTRQTGTITSEPILKLKSGQTWGLYTDKIIAINGTTYAFSTATANLLNNKAAHRVSVKYNNGSALLLYVDGVLKETIAAYTGTFPTTDGLSVLSPADGYYSNLRYNSSPIWSATDEQNAYTKESPTATNATVIGNVSVPTTIYFTASGGSLTNPTVYKADGSFVGYNGTIPDGSGLVIDTEAGTATYWTGVIGSSSPVLQNSLLTGNPFLRLNPGTESLVATTSAQLDAGTIQACWRPAVVSA